MIIYEVNLVIDQEIVSDFAAWLPGHMEQVVQLGGFTKAKWYKQSPLEWTIHYHINDRKKLDNYLENYAPKLRQEGFEKFPGKFTATRRILELCRRSFAAV